MFYAFHTILDLLRHSILRGFYMSSAIAERKSRFKRSAKQAPKGQKSKLARKKIISSKPFPWKLVFGAIAIIGVMTLLSNPIDPNSVKNRSSADTDLSSLNGFGLEK